MKLEIYYNAENNYVDKIRLLALLILLLLFSLLLILFVAFIIITDAQVVIPAVTITFMYMAIIINIQ
jgi:hypothetical protein